MRKVVLLPLFLLCFVAQALGQDVALSLDDPYKKPDLWKKLRSNPNDSTLWVKYVGKNWSVMSRKEQENIAKWRQELYIQSIADQESIIGELDNNATASTSSADLFKNMPAIAPSGAARTASETDMKQLANLESIIMQERNDIAELKKNIRENFVILEDALRDAFQELGAEYRYYFDVHPDGKYSELLWIEEQETRLKQLKQKKVSELRKQFSRR